MWVVGWAFYWTGHQKTGNPQTPPAEKKDNVTLIPAFTIEEEHIATA
jgi:hypothetical protein